jgi:hypothetical protein
MFRRSEVILIIFIMMLVVVPLSFAGDNMLNNTMMAKAWSSHDISFRPDASALKINLEEPAYNKVGKEKLLLHEHKIDDLETYNSRGKRVPADYYASNRTILQPLVGDISHYMNFSKGAKPFNSLSGNLNLPSNTSEIAQIGAAFLTNLAFHELGHAAVADYAGASGNELNFFAKDGDKFFLGTSHVDDIDDRSMLSYTMGGEFFADITFEHALRSYRENPSLYKQSLLFFSGTDFLWYCLYAFYLTDEHSSHDPIAISKQTGISRDALFSVALAKTIANAYRVYSGTDRVVPYFTVDRYSASLNVAIPFDQMWFEKKPVFN